MKKLLIQNVKIAGEQGTKDIYIRDGMVERISDKITMELTETVDASGCYALPGLIDMWCNTRDPGFESKEDINSASKSAAKGGFTTITCSPDTYPVIDNKTVVSYIIEKARKRSLVNIFPYGSMTKGNNGREISEIGEMIEAGIVAVSDGGKSVVDAGVLRNIFIYSRMFDVPVITFCEDMSLAGAGVANRGLISTMIGLAGIPREAEEVYVARDILLAKHTGARLHISQISTSGSVELVRLAKRSGVDVSCGTSPHYFTLTEKDIESYNTLVKIRPPLRTVDDTEALIAGIKDGTIDIICSGHYPVGIEDKNFEFERALYGISALESAFAVSLTALTHKNILSIEDLVIKMSTRPAEILNLKSKGRLAEGYDADIVIIDIDKKRKINASQFASKAKFSPYDGADVFGEIKYTIVKGNIVYING